jgi:S1-C subfamily serine protease
MARQVMDQLVSKGKVSRGQLGVGIQDLTPDLAKGLKIDTDEGALIAHVVPGSPAEKAGLEAGDVITKVNGETVRNSGELRNRIGLLPIGETVELEIIRKGMPKRVTAQLGEIVPEKVTVPASVTALAGVTLGAIEQGSPLYGRVEGAIILDIKPGSKAQMAGLRPGDAIIGVNQQPVRSPEDVVRAAGESGGRVLLQVLRDGGAFFVVIG